MAVRGCGAPACDAGALATVWRSRRALAGAAGIALGPAAAVASFLVLGKLTTNYWFVTDGFFVADPRLAAKPIAVTGAIWFGLRRLGTDVLAGTAVVAAAVVFTRAWMARERAPTLVPLALAAVAVLPWYAFDQGHPFRIRYMIPLVAGGAVGTSILVGWLPRLLRLPSALVLAGTMALVVLPPLTPRAAIDR